MSIDRARVARYARAATRWARLLARRRARGGLRVFYGHDRIPALGEPVTGGTAKFQRLSSRFPNCPTDFSLLYLGSTWLPRDLRALLALARRRSIPIVVNQNGVAYRAWAGDAADALNRPLRAALLSADHVLYQSSFCKRSADAFLGEPRGAWEILYNAVDVVHFSPRRRPPPGRPVLLLYGDQNERYRLELALRTLAEVRRAEYDAILLVTGRVAARPSTLVRKLGLSDAVEFVGRYAQRDAPEILRRADVLLHTQVNDSCPSTVIEAMACAVPVVYAASGGTVELVGEEAGVPVPHDVTWERFEPPAPEALAAATVRVLENRAAYGEAARRRAVERFALPQWLERHAELFATLAG